MVENLKELQAYLLRLESYGILGEEQAVSHSKVGEGPGHVRGP